MNPSSAALDPRSPHPPSNGLSVPAATDFLQQAPERERIPDPASPNASPADVILISTISDPAGPLQIISLIVGTVSRRVDGCLASPGEVITERPAPSGRQGDIVPKQKSHRGASKRFKTTASGRVVRRHSMKSHILTKKTRKRKRKLRQSTLMSSAMEKAVKGMIAS